jgi:HK97 family phage portal protein
VYPARLRSIRPGDIGDPREVTPNENLAGPNVPPISVGPTSSTNAEGNFVLGASAWSGWPGVGTVGMTQAWGAPPMEPFSELGGPTGGDWSGYGYGRQNPGGYLRRVSTVMTCVDLNTRQLASFPAYGVKDRRPVPLPSWYATPEPELYPDWSAFMKAAGASYYLAGEVILYATARYVNGYPSRFVALDPAQVYRDPEGSWYLGQNDHGIELPRGDVCHIPYQLLPGVLHRRGIGPLMWAGRHVCSAVELDAYAQAIARYGVWAVLKHPDELTATQAGELQGQWMAARYNSLGSPAVLSGGIEFETLTMSPQDMALLDLKWFDLEMIAAAMGVPSVLVNLPQNNGLNYSTTVMLADWHWRGTLRPHAQSFSGAMSLWLLPRGTDIEFDPDRYTQPPLEERARAYQTLHGIEEPDGKRAITVDEIRARERWAPYDNETLAEGAMS